MNEETNQALPEETDNKEDNKALDVCEECGGAGPLYLHSKCHPRHPTWAVLNGDQLTIECAKCGQAVARFNVVLEEKTPTTVVP